MQKLVSAIAAISLVSAHLALPLVQSNFSSMIVSISIVRYKTLFIPFALIAMAVHRLPLYLNKKCTFWKLMGSGKNGSFDLSPDWRQWALLTVWKDMKSYEDFQQDSFIEKWWKCFTTEQLNIQCIPLASHGYWDGVEPFKVAAQQISNGPLAVLTRATIRLSRLRNFWSNVEVAATEMATAKGYITSFGIGEAPIYRQATFSIWEDLESMKAFAYGSVYHKEIIKKTRAEDWYSEELFARFKIISCSGTINGTNPLKDLIKTI